MSDDKLPVFRFRNMYVGLGCALVVLLLILVDPDSGLVRQLPFGAGAVVTLVYMAKGILGSSLLYVTRKAMFDYPEADLRSIAIDARRTPEGAGFYAISIAIQTLAYAIILGFVMQV